MSSTEENGVAIAQRAGRESATAQRNAVNSRHASWDRKIAVGIALFIALGFLFHSLGDWWNGWRAELAQGKERVAARPTPTSSAVWHSMAPGATIPPHEWSKEVSIPLGCRITFAFGEDLRAQYRYYSKEWYEYARGSSPDMSHVRFMVTKEGLSTLPYAVSC